MESPTVRILAEAPELIEEVAKLRWQEWSNHPGREHLQWWVDATRRESGRDELPVTFVAVDRGAACSEQSPSARRTFRSAGIAPPGYWG